MRKLFTIMVLMLAVGPGWSQKTKSVTIKGNVSEFAVNAFPTSFLIDPGGKIVLIEIGYEPNVESDMDKKLAELFGKATAAKENSQGYSGKEAPAMKEPALNYGGSNRNPVYKK